MIFNEEKIKIIGLGKMGALVANELKTYPEYRVYKVVEESTENNTFSLGSYGTMKEYEENFPKEDISIFLDRFREDEEVTIVLEGGAPSTGCLLQLLQVIKKCKLTVVFIKPAAVGSPSTAIQNSKLCFGVLQQYARSGLLDRLIVVEKEILEQMIGDVPLSVYEKTVAQFLAYKLGMIYFFENSDKVMSGLSERPVACRIATLCLSNLEEPGQNIFFYKDFTPRLVEVYYGVSEEHLDTDPSLVRMITDHKKQHVSSYAEEPALSYGIVSMVTETPQVLGICYVSDPLSF